jgi:hypothetical protein
MSRVATYEEIAQENLRKKEGVVCIESFRAVFNGASIEQIETAVVDKISL